ncbi:MAG: DUF5106 domain-containing protein [Muribaculaceae bacterium]|nr:DUF5106 domain-containing protein [Muribaculaceae bacterium]
MNIKILALSAALLACPAMAFSQETNDSTEFIDTGVMYIDPLFEYPIAPEEISGFREKCNWLVENFWNPLDLKSKDAVDQAKINHAFKVYATTVQYADKDKVTASVDKLMKSLQKNPMLLYQMTKAAEENIYGPRAEFWIDELYARILKAAMSNKKFPKTKRPRYEEQLKKLESSMIGNYPEKFDFVRPNGDQAQFFPMSTPTIIIFGDPDCDSCRMGRLRMQSNVTFSKALADGKVNVLFIIPDPDEGWQSKVTDFPKNWTVGASDTVADIYDIREIPEVYVIGADGKMLNKHLGILDAMSTVLSLLENSK